MTLEIVYGVICATSGALVFWSRGQIDRFVAATPVIADQEGLRRYRSLARKAIQAPFLALMIQGGGLIIGIVLVKRHGWNALVAVLLVTLVLALLERYHDASEQRALRLSVSSPDLARAQRQVAEAWSRRRSDLLEVQSPR